MLSRNRTTSWTVARRGWLLCCAVGLLVPGARADFQGATHMVPFDEEAIG